MDARYRALNFLEALQASLPALEVEIGRERWQRLKSELLALLEEVERCHEENDWQDLHRKLEALGARQGIRNVIDEHLRLATGPDAMVLRHEVMRGEPRGALALSRVPFALTGRIRQLLALDKPAPIMTYPEAIVPEEVDEKTTFRLEVTARTRPTTLTGDGITLERRQSGPVDLEVEIGLPLDGSIQADGRLIHPLQVPEDRDSATLLFNLFARDSGRHTLTVSFRSQGVERLSLYPRLFVRSAEDRGTSATISTRVVVTAPMRPVSSSPFNGFVLHVENRGATGEHRFLHLTLGHGRRLLPAPLEGPVELPLGARELLVDLCRHMSGNGQLDLDNAEARELRLRSIGTMLAKTLLPPNIRRALADAPEGTALHIESDDPWVPWEMIWLGEPGAPLDHNRFLGESLAVTRWLRRSSPWESLPGGRAILVAPSDSGLQIHDERRALTDLTGHPPEELRSVLEVQRRLSGTAPYGFLHFACHGLAEPTAPLDGRLELEGGDLRPVDIPEIDVARPIGMLSGACVFLNACEAGIPGRGLSGHGGWARAFFQAGAGAFLAPSWSVADLSATLFARRFYGRIAGGGALGEATRQARLDARTLGNPDRVGYAVYAAPGARVDPPTRDP
jgi:hypothetical protein